MSANAHFSVDSSRLIVRHPFQIFTTLNRCGGQVLVSPDRYVRMNKAISTALMIIRNDSLRLLSILMRIVAVDSSQIELFQPADSQKFVGSRRDFTCCDLDRAAPQQAGRFRRTFPGRPIPPKPARVSGAVSYDKRFLHKSASEPASREGITLAQSRRCALRTPVSKPRSSAGLQMNPAVRSTSLTRFARGRRRMIS